MIWYGQLAVEKSCHTVYRATVDIGIEEFANKKERKVTVKKIVVFISEIEMVLNFYTLLLFFPICHFCLLLNCYLQCLSILVGIESQWRN